MRALLIPAAGEPVVLSHDRWTSATVLDALDATEVDSYEWPHPPRGRRYLVFHRQVAERAGWGLSLVQRRPSLVLGHDGTGLVGLDRRDLFYLGTFVVFEERIIAIADNPRRALEGGTE